MKRTGNILIGLLIAAITAVVLLAPWLMEEAELITK